MSSAGKLQEPVSLLPAVGEMKASILARLGIRRAADLLFFFPRSYEQAPSLATLEEFAERKRVSFVGTIVEMAEQITQSGKHMLGAAVRPEGGGCVRLLWFNQPFRKNELSVGTRLIASGQLRSTVVNWEMVQPQISILATSETPNLHKPLPVYPLTEGLKQPAMRALMRAALPGLIELVDEALPNQLRSRLDVGDVRTALREIHFPPCMAAAEAAQRRFKLQELLVLQLAIALQRQTRQQAGSSLPCEPTGKIHARILNRLRFQPTPDQLTAIDEIGSDMARDQPMNRLLQGDVGSGKTLVAQYAMLLCAAYGYQAALMAPTEVLARQHANNLERNLSASRVRVALITGNMPRSQRTNLLEQVRAGDIDLLVGTQALLSAAEAFPRLALVIVDEQHKFGVMQRAQLRTEHLPHYLVLSATPIPRTIAMTAFGDLDVSTIRTKPPGRAAVHTYVSERSNLNSWWQFVEAQLKQGRQAYVIVPRVDETGNAEIMSVKGVYEDLHRGPFAHRRIGLLHGRLSSQEKELVLGQFMAKEVDLLVASTVVEVGIDIPNATVMSILDADRLGLSQLHQLRGRISRGSHPGYVCGIASPACTTNDNQRLKAFESCQDGFELAEMDLRMRGPGDLLGTAQSGLPSLRIANLIDDAALVEQARQVAREILSSDPRLSNPELSRLVKQTLRRYGGSMQLSDVG